MGDLFKEVLIICKWVFYWIGVFDNMVYVEKYLLCKYVDR